MTDLEIVELAARRAYDIDYGMPARNLMKVMADEIVKLRKERDAQGPGASEVPAPQLAADR